MLEVESTGQRGRVATRSGQNVLESEHFEVNISKIKRDRVLVTIKREWECAGCLSMVVVVGVAESLERTEIASRIFHRFS